MQAMENIFGISACQAKPSSNFSMPFIIIFDFYACNAKNALTFIHAMPNIFYLLCMECKKVFSLLIVPHSFISSIFKLLAVLERKIKSNCHAARVLTFIPNAFHSALTKVMQGTCKLQVLSCRPFFGTHWKERLQTYQPHVRDKYIDFYIS